MCKQNPMKWQCPMMRWNGIGWQRLVKVGTAESQLVVGRRERGHGRGMGGGGVGRPVRTLRSDMHKTTLNERILVPSKPINTTNAQPIQPPIL
mgnify:CR=1 FL=1